MVFTSIVNFVRCRGPDEFWRKRKIFKLSAAFIGRRRNCYGIAIRNVHRALAFATKGRKLKRLDMKNLWDTRLQAATAQHEMELPLFRESLYRSNVLLNRKSLMQLACWEPYTFKSLVDVAQKTANEQAIVIHKHKGLLSGGVQPNSFQRKPPQYDDE